VANVETEVAENGSVENEGGMKGKLMGNEVGNKVAGVGVTGGDLADFVGLDLLGIV
jgi:hypothetical protein